MQGHSLWGRSWSWARISSILTNIFIVSGKPCFQAVGMRALEDIRLNMAELTKENLDLIILANMQQNRVNSSQTKQTATHTDRKERRRASVKFFLLGRQVCRSTYLFAHGVGIKRYKNLCKHYDNHGFGPRRHGNVGKSSHNAFSISDEQSVISFISNYADYNAMPLPGRMPKMKDYTVMMLPSDVTKTNLWRKYSKACAEASCRAVGLTKFKNIWKLYLPHIAIMKIASDLCDTCQQNNNLIMKSVNCSEAEKSAQLIKQEQHLALAKECRDYYKQQCEDSSIYWNSLAEEQKKSQDLLDGTLHISFDYAQNVLIPHSPQQVGPIYFKTPRKCHIFGICSESAPKQINYLIDEAVLTGKGANETISYLHHYLTSDHSVNCKNLQFHCDNCRGQNKNNAVIQYMCNRLFQGFNSNIEVSFMLPYHTRFGPDWCFGLIKMKYKHSYISSISDLAEVVLLSTTKEINIPQLISESSSSNTLVPVRKWKIFLESYFKKISNLTRYHHFRMTSSEPGIVFVREFPSSPETRLNIVKDQAKIPELLSSEPELISPPGLSPERAWYLYENVRQHCEGDNNKDSTCPKPSVPKPRSMKAHPSQDPCPCKND